MASLRRSQDAAVQEAWEVERTFAWLRKYRRLVVRWDRDLPIYSAFFHLVCLMITLRQS